RCRRWSRDRARAASTVRLCLTAEGCLIRLRPDSREHRNRLHGIYIRNRNGADSPYDGTSAAFEALLRLIRAAIRRRKTRNVAVSDHGDPALQRDVRGVQRLPIVAPGGLRAREHPAQSMVGWSEYGGATDIIIDGGTRHSFRSDG